MKDYSSYITIFLVLEIVGAILIVIGLVGKSMLGEKQQKYEEYNNLSVSKIESLISDINSNNEFSVTSFISLIGFKDDGETNFIKKYANERLLKICSNHTSKFDEFFMKRKVNLSWLKKIKPEDLESYMNLFLRKRYIQDFAQALGGVNNNFNKNYTICDINEFLYWIESDQWKKSLFKLKNDHLN